MILLRFSSVVVARRQSRAPQRNEDIELSFATWIAEEDDWPTELLDEVRQSVFQLIDTWVPAATAKFIEGRRTKKKLGLGAQ